MELCAKVECTTKPNWLELPIDLTKNILQRLDTVDLVTSARNVCPLWWNVCKDPLMWRTIHMTKRVSPFDFRCLEKICRCAIDLSCGHLEEIAVDSFGPDELLEYMAHRTSRLRRLQLFCCKDISDKGLIDFVWKFSLLEEFDITYNRNLSKSLETIGANCPLLKSLNLCRRLVSFCCNESDDEVFAIAKTMPGLCHLKLSGILLNNFGLLSILHGCPHLDSLDLQDSLCLPLTEDLRKRCHEQIKVFQLPNNYELPLNSLYVINVDKHKEKEYNDLCGDGSNIDRCGDNSTFVTYPGDDYIDR